ncbi:leucine-rich repeat extensin-like protein 6 [Magnolia sinica]|uniref:leucine-rich repeat extensin-like protein 6 n=1 Tax=Magnolia sinica TaxID=86752 RepID=UPI00265AB634|nr:leucine-rich repeat extensin-like protein 6 [Magnolia sinica]
MSQAHQLLRIALAIIMITVQIDCSPSRELDESGLPPPAPEVQCSVCTSCNNPCNQSPPPPPPSPPPTPKKPRSPDCPPPPPTPYFYMGGPPGSLYPIDPNHFPSGTNRKIISSLTIFILCGLLGLVAF